MAIKQSMKGDVVVLSISGNLMGGDETKEVHEKVKQLIQEGHKKFVIDLSKVKWMNSTGLGVMISCLTSVQNAQGDLKISGATEKVKSLFIMTKLITVFDAYPSVDDAVAAFK